MAVCLFRNSATSRCAADNYVFCGRHSILSFIHRSRNCAQPLALTSESITRLYQPRAELFAGPFGITQRAVTVVPDLLSLRAQLGQTSALHIHPSHALLLPIPRQPLIFRERRLDARRPLQGHSRQPSVRRWSARRRPPRSAATVSRLLCVHHLSRQMIGGAQRAIFGCLQSCLAYPLGREWPQ